MITREQAAVLRYRDTLEHVSYKNADGTPLRARVNGKLKKPNDPVFWQLPLKYDMTKCFYLTTSNASAWRLPPED